MTNTIICTIDPATARDLDDALSIKKLENGNYEVGVHIADVSYFVAENTILDEEARLRTTSVYLPVNNEKKIIYFLKLIINLYLNY